MAKTNRRQVDTVERKQRLAVRNQRVREDIEFASKFGVILDETNYDELDPEDYDDVADEISSRRTNRAY